VSLLEGRDEVHSGLLHHTSTLRSCEPIIGTFRDLRKMRCFLQFTSLLLFVSAPRWCIGFVSVKGPRKFKKGKQINCIRMSTWLSGAINPTTFRTNVMSTAIFHQCRIPDYEKWSAKRKQVSSLDNRKCFHQTRETFVYLYTTSTTASVI
jgi:hypothetical protein